MFENDHPFYFHLLEGKVEDFKAFPERLVSIKTSKQTNKQKKNPQKTPVFIELDKLTNCEKFSKLIIVVFLKKNL